MASNTLADVVDCIDRAQRELKQLSRLLSTVPQVKERLAQLSTTRPVRPCWEGAHRLYVEASKECPPGATLADLHTWLATRKARSPATYAKLPATARTFSQYIRAYLKAKGLKSHRELKGARRAT